MAGTIYLNATKEQKKKKDYVAPKEKTTMTRKKKARKSPEPQEGVSRQVHIDKTGAKTFADTGEVYKKENLYKAPEPTKEKESIVLNEPEKKTPFLGGEGEIFGGVGGLTGFLTGKQLPDVKAGTVPLGGSAAAKALIKGIGSGEGIGQVANQINRIGLAKGATPVGEATQGAISAANTQQASLSGSNVGKAFTPIVGDAASNFIANTKSVALTKSLLLKYGMNPKVLLAVGGAIGTYPFAYFELAEASDKIGIAMFQAAQNGDEEEVLRLVEIQNDMLDMDVWEKVLMAIPVANILNGVANNIGAAIVSAKSFREAALKEIERSQTGGETEFAQERRESDEASTQRKLEEQNLDSQYFQLIRDKKYDEAEELLQLRLKEEA